MVQLMKTSATGIAAIRGYEGSRTRAYQDVAGVWTIGVGHTGSDVHPDSHWTQEQIDEALAHDLSRFEIAVDQNVAVALTQGQFDALVSLCFNIGSAAFSKSTLVRLLNQGDYRAACCQFAVWHNAGGAFNSALLSRRALEMWMFARAS